MPDFAQALREQDADPSPFMQFRRWFEEAGAAGVRAPEAAAVATASASGAPSVRMVLVKEADESGFVFYTNYASRKAAELTANAFASLLFYWDPLGRQVRIEGPVRRTGAEESAAYVRTRPRASQVSALASPQSSVISSREWLESQVADLTARYDAAELPVPAGWGGFRLTPRLFEFWQHREDRLHDRLRYTLQDDGGWRIERLAP
jgi:pyridoxamine 5'-phosphate oxidase